MKIQPISSSPRRQEAASLYRRVGGLYPIARVVDEFIDRLVVNETLNANPVVVAARDPATRAGLKFHVTAFVAAAAGGPQAYSGRSMKETHARLNISGREWEAMLAELRSVLYKFNVADTEQDEIVSMVESLRGDIVTRV